MSGRWWLLTAILRWEAAAAAVGVDARLRLGRTLAERSTGVVLHLRLGPGHCAEDLVQKEAQLAAFFRCARAEVVEDVLRRDRCTLLLHATHVPPRCLYPRPSGQLSLLPRSVYEPVPLGRDDGGAEISLPLFVRGSGGTSVLIGGVPGVGKTLTVRAVLAGVAQTRACIVAIDPTGGAEASRWGERIDVAVRSAEYEPTAQLLGDVLALIKRRGEVLGVGGEIDLLPPLVLVCDELAELAAAGTPRQQDEARAMVRRIVALGRKANVSCVLATQRTTSTSIDITTRSLVAWRIALAHPDDPNGSEALLGPGNRQASGLRKSDVGAAYLTNGGQPHLLRVYEVPDDEVSVIAHQPIALTMCELEQLDSVALRELTM